jgi:hypothetical protein
MANILKLSLAAVAIGVLAACGGGGGDSSEVADVYVGTWKSACYSTNSNTGTVYTKRVRTLSKTNATELASTTSLDSVFSDAACVTNVGFWIDNPPTIAKYVLGAKAQFLGANTDTYVQTIAATGASFTGYMVANGAQLNMADAVTGSAPPTGWGIYSPYIKQ